MTPRLGVLLTVALALSLVSCEEVEKPRLIQIYEPNSLHVERGVAYAKAEGKDLRLDVFMPEGKGPFPMVVYVPGGGWYKEKQEWLREPTIRYICRQGFVVFNVSYRLAPEHKFPDPVNDVLGAIIFAKTNAAKYDADPARTAVMGDSAGANLAAMAALKWDNPQYTPSFRGDGRVTAQTQANVFLFGVYDVAEMYHLVSFYAIFDNPKLAGERYLGGSPEQVPDRYRMASPIHHVRKDLSPTLVVCGSNDPLFSQSQAFHDKLDQMGVPNGFYVSAADNHGFTMYPPPFTKGALDCYAAVTAFLELELRYSRRAASPPAAQPQVGPGKTN